MNSKLTKNLWEILKEKKVGVAGFEPPPLLLIMLTLLLTAFYMK